MLADHFDRRRVSPRVHRGARAFPIGVQHPRERSTIPGSELRRPAAETFR